MSEITAVPLRPIKKGTLTGLWIGVSAAVLIAGGLAWAGTATGTASDCAARDFAKGLKPTATPSGLMIATVKPGTGAKPTDTDVVLIDYKGSLRNGAVFDEAQRTPLPVSGMIAGFTEALKVMQVGGSYRICIPAKLGYGAQSPSAKIPANSALFFDIAMLDFRSQAEIQAMQMQMQMQQQGGAPTTPPPAGR